jgi:hypothetical protein
MKKLIAITLWLVISGGAHADVWSWVDMHGDMHFVDSKDGYIYVGRRDGQSAL